MSDLPDAVRTLIEADGARVILSVHAVGGGDTSEAARVETSRGRFFVKWADAPAGDSYAAEAHGLQVVGGDSYLKLASPTVHGLRLPTADGPGALVLSWIEAGTSDADGWREFGRALVALHRTRVPASEFMGVNRGYGWTEDNWIGSKPQRNAWHPHWPTFFGEQRLLAQRDTVRALGAWDDAWDGRLERLVARLPDILPATPPRSPVHGDLWAGNAFPTADGRFALIDPAVYIGHREVDLAMTELFGGFSPAFYEGYRDAWPLDPGYPERREIYNLFHLVNHLTHGPQYRAPVEATLRRFAG